MHFHHFRCILISSGTGSSTSVSFSRNGFGFQIIRRPSGHVHRQGAVKQFAGGTRQPERQTEERKIKPQDFPQVNAEWKPAFKRDSEIETGGTTRMRDINSGGHDFIRIAEIGQIQDFRLNPKRLEPGITTGGFSLPEPTTSQTSPRPSIAARQSLRPASGSFSPCRPTAAESDSAPYAAPAPCRTQGVRGAADTPPASHGHATLPNEAPCRTQGVRGAADTPPASHDHAAPESPRPRGGLKTQLAAWQTVMTIWPKISSATQPRDRSFSGLASP